MTTLVETPRIILATVTSDGAAVAGRHTPVDATAGNRTMTLPTSATPGAHLSVEKVDASSNTVTISGKIRGTTSTLPLSLRYQSVTFVADQTGTSWTPTAGHITAASLATTYVPQGSQVISAKEFPFYAKGDGTTDDTTAIQNAINSAAAYSLTIGKPTVLLPPGQYMVSHSLTGGTNGYFAFRGTSKRATVITATSGFTGGYILEARAGFDVSDLTLQGNDQDGVYGFGGTAKAAGTGVLSVLYTPTVLQRVIIKNVDYGIRFSGEAQFPLKAIWDDIYVYGFRTAGIQIALGGTQYSGQSVSANDGQSAWSFDNIVCTNKGYSGSSIPAAGTAVTANSPDSTHDAVAWSGSDATEFGYVIMRRTTGSSDPFGWTWVGEANNGTTTFSASKTAATTYDYAVLRKTTGFYVRYPRAIVVGTLQAEYCATGAHFENVYGASVGSYYYEWRQDSTGASPTPIGNGIVFSNSYGVTLHSAYGQYVNSLVVSRYSRAVKLDGVVTTNAQRSAVHYMTTDGTMTLELGQIVSTGSAARLTTDGVATSNNLTGTNVAGEDPATVNRRVVNHPTQAEFEADYQGARKVAVGADSTSGYVYFASGLPTASSTYDGQVRRSGSRLYQCTNQGAGYAWYPLTVDQIATAQVEFVTGKRSDNTQAASFGYDGTGQLTATTSASTKDFIVNPGGVRLGTTGPLWRTGTGSPEGVLTAPVGSLWTRTDGASGTVLYVKESGASNTGWVAKDSSVSNTFGYPYTVDPGIVRSGDAISVQTANQASYLRVLGGGSISKIGIRVVVSSGNISLAVYSNTGSGRAAAPGTRLATTGAIACPAAGYQEIALGSTITVSPGDWICLTADNTTATFQSLLGAVADSGLGNGRQYRQSTAHPAPATVGTLVATIGYTFVLAGV